VAPGWAWAAGFMAEAEAVGINKVKSLGDPPKGFKVFLKYFLLNFMGELIDRKLGFSVKNVQMRKIHGQNYFIAVIHDSAAFTYSHKF
jgi:hypothetical protein